MMAKKEWIKCDSWDDLPIGEWLVTVDTKRDDKYHIAQCTGAGTGKLIIVGSYFSFDMDNIVAYTTFDKYEEDE